MIDESICVYQKLYLKYRICLAVGVVVSPTLSRQTEEVESRIK